MGRMLAWFGGICGSIGVLCCFTPILPIVLTALGAVGLIDVLYRDAVLFPFAAGAFLLMGMGLWLARKSN